MLAPFRTAFKDSLKFDFRFRKKESSISRPITGARNIPLLRIPTDNVINPTEATSDLPSSR